MKLEFTDVFRTSAMNTIISLPNESIFTHLEQDLLNPNTLLACIDNAVATIDIKKRTAAAYSGLPNSAGYVEDRGTKARYNEAISLAQINKTTIIVADKRNFCLRRIERDSINSLTFAGRCTEYGDSGAQEETTTTTDLRLSSPQSLLYEGSTQRLYLADMSSVYYINMADLRVYKLIDSEYTIYSLVKSAIDPHMFIGAIAGGIVSIHTANGSKVINIIAGQELPPLENKALDGDFAKASFNQPRAVIHLYSNLYMTAEYGSSKLRGLDIVR